MVVGKKYNVSVKTISRIWQRAKRCYDRGKSANVEGRIKEHSGRPRKEYKEILEKVRKVPFRKSPSLRSVAASIGEPLSRMQRIEDECMLKRVSSTIKSENCKLRKKYRACEKWYYLTKIKTNFYILPD